MSVVKGKLINRSTWNRDSIEDVPLPAGGGFVEELLNIFYKYSVTLTRKCTRNALKVSLKTYKIPQHRQRALEVVNPAGSKGGKIQRREGFAYLEIFSAFLTAYPTFDSHLR